MTTRFLDLDSLATKEEVVIQLNGKRHVFKEMSVDDFVWAQAKAVGITDANSDQEIMSATVEMLSRSFPTIPREELTAMGLSKLRALNDFVMEVALHGADTAAKDGEVAEGKAKTESPVPSP